MSLAGIRSKTGLVALLSCLWACGGEDGSSDGSPNSPTELTCTAGEGRVKVSVAGGLPAGGAFRVTIGTFKVSGTQCILAGEYAVSVSPAVMTNPIVSQVFTGEWSLDDGTTPQTLKVPAGGQVNIVLKPSEVQSSNKLWIGNGSGDLDVLGFSSSALASSGTIDATVEVKGALVQVGGLAFDRSGNLWVVERALGEHSVRRYSGHFLGTTGNGDKSADLIINGQALGGNAAGPGAVNLAFDVKGGLWVSVMARDRVVKYSQAQLAQSGAPVPVVELGGPGSGMKDPDGLAFDKSGNLWIADTGAHRVYRYDSSRLAQSTSVAPDFIVEAKPPSPATGVLSSPSTLAFDSSGNLWVAYAGSGVIAKMESAELGAKGQKSFVPGVQLRIAGLPAGARLEGIAFDRSNALWVSYGPGKNIARLTLEQLKTSGEKAPSTLISSSDFIAAEKIAFFPAPDGLGLFHGDL